MFVQLLVAERSSVSNIRLIVGALNAGGCEGRKKKKTHYLLVVRLQALDDAGNPEVVVAFSAVQGPVETRRFK